MSISLIRAEQVPPTVNFTELREIDQDELRAINEAITYCREYADRHTVSLVRTAKVNFDITCESLVKYPDAALPVAVREVSVSLVSLLLIWRMFLDHSRHDLSQRFGSSSEEFREFEVATNNAFDNHMGYRLFEGLRNYVQHVGMPEVHCKVNRRQGGFGEAPIVSQVTVTLSRDGLLDSLRAEGINRKLQNDLANSSEVLMLADLIQDAMAGFEKLVQRLTDIDSSNLERHILRLRSLVSETSPGIPMIGDLSNVGTAGGSLDLTRFEDIFHFILPSDES